MALFQGPRQRFGAVGHALTFHAYHKLEPGPRRLTLLDAPRPAYDAWFLREGDAARPSYVECRRALREHMPELVAVWERMCELAGGGDAVARMLSPWPDTS